MTSVKSEKVLHALKFYRCCRSSFHGGIQTPLSARQARFKRGYPLLRLPPYHTNHFLTNSTNE